MLEVAKKALEDQVANLNACYQAHLDNLSVGSISTYSSATSQSTSMALKKKLKELQTKIKSLAGKLQTAEQDCTFLCEQLENEKKLHKIDMHTMGDLNSTIAFLKERVRGLEDNGPGNPFPNLQFNAFDRPLPKEMFEFGMHEATMSPVSTGSNNKHEIKFENDCYNGTDVGINTNPFNSGTFKTMTSRKRKQVRYQDENVHPSGADLLSDATAMVIVSPNSKLDKMKPLVKKKRKVQRQDKSSA